MSFGKLVKKLLKYLNIIFRFREHYSRQSFSPVNCREKSEVTFKNENLQFTFLSNYGIEKNTGFDFLFDLKIFYSIKRKSFFFVLCFLDVFLTLKVFFSKKCLLLYYSFDDFRYSINFILFLF